MDGLLVKAGEVLLNNGLPGVIIIYLLYDRKGMQEQLKELMAALNLSQENRIKEARETTSALDTVKDTIDILKQFMRGGNDRGRGNV
jgi:hypothetical protein